MTRDEIREITAIVGDDRLYSHFVHRINKEFELSDEDRNSQVFVMFQNDKDGNRIGFCVIGHSPVKMKVWENTFKDEGWVEPDYKMDTPCYELMYMYVRPEQRGKGFGKTLFNKAINFAGDQKVKAIYAYVSDRNDTALNFYKRMDANIIQDFSDEEFTTAFLNWIIN